MTALLLCAVGAVVGVTAFAADEPSKQPVYIVLYSRFYDHSHQHTTEERIQRLLPLLDRLRQKYPQSGISALLQFSGTVSELMSERNPGLHFVDKVKDYESRGLVDIGYTGEEEPSYLYRPKANLLLADTPEKRWTAKEEAAEHFLNDFKNPVTGQPLPGLMGGLKRTQEVFGPAVFATGIATMIGGDTPITHAFRKMDPEAVLGGIPQPDQRYDIEGFGFSADNFSKFMSPSPETSPDVFWEDNALRLSAQSLSDNKPHNTDETVDALKKVFAKLDRTHPRVIKIEVASYLRYLTKRADGSVRYDPMEWLYYHPDAPQFPETMKPLVLQGQVEAGYRNEEAVLNWLLNEYLPANPGSRFLSIHELAKMAENSAGSEVTSDEIRGIATSIDAHFRQAPTDMPRFETAGDKYFSNAEAFELLAESLGKANPSNQKDVSLPPSVKLTPIYGPIESPQDMGPIRGSVTVADVLRAAAQIAPPLANDTWKSIPDNMVPPSVQVGALHVNAAQFLHLMAWSYLNPAPDRILQLSSIAMTSQATFMFPKNTMIKDQGNSWTFKPAPLKLESAVVAAR
ncbi:MAG: hypothetical protein WBE37_31595 [Bryobacteraceae bacterium]